jgi:opacity protein-like surface antigen
MKTLRNLSLLVAILAIGSGSWAQENRFTISGGYSFANIEDADQNANGWRINGLYEFNPNEGKLAHGFSFGYIGLSTTVENVQSVDYKSNSWPIYYAPKLMFGGDSFNAFVKGALGMHFTTYKRMGGLGDIKSTDTGFYGGLGAGVMKEVSDNVFLNLEYEWACLSNSYLRNGFMNTIMLGLGFKF